MAITIGIYNRKGGIGKTHSCINIGACLAMKGYKVLLLDADSQLNLTTFFFGEDEEVITYRNGDPEVRSDLTTLYGALEEGENIFNAIRQSKEYHIKRKLASKFRRYDFSFDILLGSSRMDDVEVEDLSYFTKPLEMLEFEYDFILIDFPPSFTDLNMVYMAGCDYLLVPAKLGEPASTQGYFNVRNKVDGIRLSGLNPDLKILGLFFTMAQDYKANQREHYNEFIDIEAQLMMFKNYIHMDYAANVLADKTSDPLIVCAPSSACTKDYIRLTDEIIDRLEEE